MSLVINNIDKVNKNIMQHIKTREIEVPLAVPCEAQRSRVKGGCRGIKI